MVLSSSMMVSAQRLIVIAPDHLPGEMPSLGGGKEEDRPSQHQRRGRLQRKLFCEER